MAVQEAGNRRGVRRLIRGMSGIGIGTGIEIDIGGTDLDLHLVHLVLLALGRLDIRDLLERVDREALVRLSRLADQDLDHH